MSTLRNKRSKAGQLRIENAADGSTAELYLYDEIGFWGTTAKDFIDQLNQIKAPTLNLHINSPGGDVFDAVAMYNALRRYDGKTIVTVDGIAASSASFLAQAGDEIVMGLGSFMMIHNASAIVAGDHRLMREVADVAEKVTDNIASIYEARSKRPRAEWRSLMDAETWMTAEEAVDTGLADRIGEREAIENRFDLSTFSNIPDVLKRRTAFDPRAEEQRLRDEGLSASQAKAEVAKRRGEHQQRDVADEFANLLATIQGVRHNPKQ